MNRAEARQRFGRLLAVALVLMLGLGGVSFGMSRWLRGRRLAGAAPAPSAATAVNRPPRPLEVPAPEIPGASTGPSASNPPKVTAAPPAVRESAPKITERTITLDLTPPMGIKLSIDGAPSIDESTRATLRLDTRPHSLVFDCDVCTAVQVTVPAGERDERLSVNVPIKPATLIVKGDSDKTYQIVEDPQLVVQVGANSVALKSQYRSITVRQIETDERRPVRLVAGQEIRAVF